MNRGRPRTSRRLLAENCAWIRPPNGVVWQPNRPDPMRVDLSATWPDGVHLTIPVDLTSTAMPTGGRRAWLVCPACRGRRGRLYQADPAHDFVCRVCLGLSYSTQYRKGKSARNIRMVRKLRDRKWFRRQLGKILGDV